MYSCNSVHYMCRSNIYRPSFFITMGQLWSPCPTLHNVVFYYTEATVKWLKSVSFLYFLIIGILLRWWRHDQLWCGVYRVRLRWSTHTPTGKANIQQGSLIRNCYTDEIYSFVDWNMSWLRQTRPLLQPYTIFVFKNADLLKIIIRVAVKEK